MLTRRLGWRSVAGAAGGALLLALLLRLVQQPPPRPGQRTKSLEQDLLLWRLWHLLGVGGRWLQTPWLPMLAHLAARRARARALCDALSNEARYLTEMRLLFGDGEQEQAMHPGVLEPGSADAAASASSADPGTRSSQTSSSSTLQTTKRAAELRQLVRDMANLCPAPPASKEVAFPPDPTLASTASMPTPTPAPNATPAHALVQASCALQDYLTTESHRHHYHRYAAWSSGPSAHLLTGPHAPSPALQAWETGMRDLKVEIKECQRLLLRSVGSSLCV